MIPLGCKLSNFKETQNLIKEEMAKPLNIKFPMPLQKLKIQINLKSGLRLSTFFYQTYPSLTMWNHK